MAALGFEGRGVAIFVHGGLFLKDGGDGFEGHAEVDVLAIADTALNASTVVGGGGDPTFRQGAEDIVLLGASGCDAIEAIAIFEAFDGVDAEHGLAEGGV